MEFKPISKMSDAEIERYREEIENELSKVLFVIRQRKMAKSLKAPQIPKFETKK